jgi:hypothetical protein
LFYSNGDYSYSGVSGVYKFYDSMGNGVVQNPDESEEKINTDDEGNTYGHDSNGNAFYTDVYGNKWSVDADGN